MPVITQIPTRSNEDLVASVFHNTYFVTGLSDILFTYGAFIDVARTWTATQTFSVAQTFAATVTVSAGGIAVTGNSTITGTLGSLTGITSSGTAALATVTVSNTLAVTSTSTFGAQVTVSSGGMAVTGNSTIAGTLTSLTGITSSGTAALATVTVSTGLTVSATSTMRAIAAQANNTYDIGASGTRFATIYGTTGDFTIGTFSSRLILPSNDSPTGDRTISISPSQAGTIRFRDDVTGDLYELVGTPI